MSLVHNVIGPPTAARVLLLVHGYGADERDLGGILSYLDPEGRFLTVLPRGPVAAPPGFAWFDLGGGDDTTFDASLDALDDLLDEVCAAHGHDRSEAILGGFSQGGWPRAGARPAAQRPAPPERGAGHERPAAGRGRRLRLGRRDRRPGAGPARHRRPDAPRRGARTLATQLMDHGVPVVYQEYPMGHGVALESIQAAKAWLDAVVGGERPSEPIPEAPPEPLVKPVTTAGFEAEVLRADGPVIVDFWAPWCQPCRAVSPVVEQIAAMRQGSYKVVKVNIDEEPAIAQQFEVQSIPMIGLFRNGRLERTALGAKARQALEAELGMLVIP